MNNKYNLNLINQLDNENLYEENLFDLILEKADINELKNEHFYLSHHEQGSVYGNFEALLKRKSEYKSTNIQCMYEKITVKCKEHLLKPLYFVSLNKKDYILEQSGYEIFKDVNMYVRKLSKGEAVALNDTEEKFVIDWFFKVTPNIYIKKEDTDEVTQLYEIFNRQKAYLNAKNDKSTINHFFENHGMKKILSLFTIEQRNSLMKEQLSHTEIINSYYKKLLRQKHFDLAQNLTNSSAKQIVDTLYAQVSEHELIWFKIFLEKGTALNLSDLEKKLENKHVPPPYKEKTKISAALLGGIELLRKVLPEIKDEKIIKLFFVATIEAQNERYYMELRSFVDLPNDDMFREYINKKDIHKKSIDAIEKELFKNKLENKYAAKEKSKQPKI